MYETKKNRFLMVKCISLGALTFPTPILIFLYLLNIDPAHEMTRIMIVLFLILAGGVVGLVAYFRTENIQIEKDWVPSNQEESRFLKKE